MNVLDLFSGIGGFSLGLERAGMRTVAFCEIDLYCQRVLTKHWPAVPVFGDIRNLTAEALADAAWNVCAEQEAGGAVRERIGQCGQSGDVADANGIGCEEQSLLRQRLSGSERGGQTLADADEQQARRLTISWDECDQWLVEPDVGRVAHGVPFRVDRLRALGNAIVPQIAEIIGKAIMAHG